MRNHSKRGVVVQRLPSLAACLMVRNEAASLHRCLETVQGRVDAIYVTDTGSTDESVEVARSFGANVRSYRWSDNFAEARNASMESVREDWILILDADDLLGGSGGEDAWRDLPPTACAATVSYFTHPQYTPTRAHRLIRNLLGARFTGRIHENIADWLHRSRGEGMEELELPLEIHHTGFSGEAMPGRYARNLPLLQAAWQDLRTHDGLSRRMQIGAELGLAMGWAGRTGEAAVFLRLLILEMTMKRKRVSWGLQALVNLLWLVRDTKSEEGALHLTRHLAGLYADAAAYQLHRGLAELRIGNPRLAVKWFERFREELRQPSPRFEIPVPIEYLGAGLSASLGNAHMRAGDYNRACGCFEQAVAQDRGNVEYALRRIVAKGMLPK
ncbi:MAG: hypothetical protein RL088_4071 [Verrucomicrobiota bacterium]